MDTADVVRRIKKGTYGALGGALFLDDVKEKPDLYGAFPTDPYSHTPKGKGVQQPGMTGQVKEDLLSRAGELGVRVKEGILSFEPLLLRGEEFIDHAQAFNFYDINQKKNEILLLPKSLAKQLYLLINFYHLKLYVHNLLLPLLQLDC